MRAPARILHRSRRLPVVVRDLPLGLALLAASLVPALQPRGTQLGDLPSRSFDALAVVALLLECLPLSLRRRAPLASVTLVLGGFALDQLRAYHLVAGVALIVALLSAGLHLQRHRRATAAGLTLAYVALVAGLMARGSTEGPIGFVTFYLVAMLAWGAGAWLRAARDGEAERQRHAAESAVAGERTRLARELHDVVTHHVTAMVVQAQAARYLTSAPDRLEEALGSIADTGRLAASDLRQLLQLLEPGAAATSPPPSIDDIGALVDQARRAGQPVELRHRMGAIRPTGSAGLTAYRVVQEALTNALKHAHGSRTVVAVDQCQDDLIVEVSTEPALPTGQVAVQAPAGAGRGLAGLRERLDTSAGELDAGPRPDGGFVVRARIPLASRS